MVSASQNLATQQPATSVQQAVSPVVVEQLATEQLAAEQLAAGLDVKTLAAEGYFQAIAYWLNEPLILQSIYVQVSADDVLGRVKVLAEFERVPEPQRLVRFVCDRLYRLNSGVIEGVHLIARTIGSSQTLWEQRVRIPTSHQRQSKLDAPKLGTPKLNAQKKTELATPNQNSQKRQLIHESSRSKIARDVVRSQFKFFRAALISGTATAALLFGGLTALVLSDRLSTPVIATDPKEEMIPWYGKLPEATEVVARSSGNRPESNRAQTIEAALETVAVVPHEDVQNPQDPTITLLFGGELSLNDFVFEEAESLDQLFADLSIYQNADVAMVGLSEPLATPSTTLQEDFYQRTRPEAVKALKAGGIDIVNLASEGTLTYGARGLDETLRTLDRQGIYRVGAGRDQKEAHRPEILEVKGQRIAYLGYNPEALTAAKEDKAGVALTKSKERSHILEDIRAIRPQVDWVVVNYRWGDLLGSKAPKDKASSLAAVPEDWQKSLAYDAVDAGADLVVGYHPSQIQGAEVYRDRAIAYSLGDFVFGDSPLTDHDTAALRVSLRNQQMKVEFLPVSIRDSQIEMATGDQGITILQSIRDASKTLEKPLRFPTVLDAQPHITQPDPAPFVEPALTPTETFNQPAQPLKPIEFTLPTSTPPEVEEQPYDPPAVHPILQESDALFPVNQ